MKYMTVAEYAAAHGISEQAVYKQIKAGKLPTVEREENGKRKKFILNEPPEASAGTGAASDAALISALAALTEQLKAKDAQIAALTQLLDHSQQLQAHTNKLLERSARSEALSDNEPPEAGAGTGAASGAGTPGSAQEVPKLGTTPPERKRGFWAKFFGTP